MKITQEIILSYLKELKLELKDYGIEEIALFGSFAHKTENVYSDIDIAVKKKKNFLDEYSAYDYLNLVSQIKSKILKNLHRQTDIFDLDSQSSFKEQIQKKLIYV